MAQSGDPFKKLIRDRPTQEEAQQIIDDLYKMDDRASAIIAAQWLEDSVEDLIYARLINLNKTDYTELFVSERAPLSTFASKIRFLHALGMLPSDMRADLNTIKDIRNGFAHARKKFTFSTPEFSRKCLGLKTMKQIPRSHFNLDENTEWPPSEPKMRFLIVTSLITSTLSAIAREPRKYLTAHYIFPDKTAKPSP